MILTYDDISSQIALGNIVIDPAPKEINANSVDLTLGDTLERYEPGALDAKNPPETHEQILLDSDGFLLSPHTLYLASTVERTYSPHHIPVIYGKSSLGRLGLLVHFTAGFGDIGFNGQWTLELSCVQPLRVYPGMKICQVVFFKPSSIPTRDYGTLGRYNNQKGIVSSKGSK